jgi:hypothetical protein
MKHGLNADKSACVYPGLIRVASAALCLLLAGCPGQKRVVLYSAQDKEFADQILADF